MIRQEIVRQDIHAGTWYPNDKKDIERFTDPSAKKQKAVAGVVPHAGWPYSGKTAGEVFSRMEPASVYVLIGPNHRGTGSEVAVFPEGAWKTPLGNLPVNGDLAQAIIKKSEVAEADPMAHIQEHSIEVQLPFIKLFSSNAEIVPISMYNYHPTVCRKLGEGIAAALKEKKLDKDTILIASTDMSHYIPAQDADTLDHIAIKKNLQLAPEDLLNVVEKDDISMCGSGPTAAVLWAARELGATKAELVSYTNSGQTTGDYEQVVGYAGIVII